MKPSNCLVSLENVLVTPAHTPRLCFQTCLPQEAEYSSGYQNPQKDFKEIRRELMIWTFSIHGISGGKGDTASKPGQGIQLVTMFSPTLATPLTVARQTPLSVGFPRQEYWSGLPFPSPGHLPDPGIKPRSPAYLPEMLLFFLLLRVLFSSILC